MTQMNLCVLVYLATLIGVGLCFWMDFRVIRLLHLRQQDLKARVEQLEGEGVLG